MLRSLENLLVPLKAESEHVGSPSKANELTEAEVAFVRTHCIEAVVAKWTDKAVIKSENIAAPQFQDKAQGDEE